MRCIVYSNALIFFRGTYNFWFFFLLFSFHLVLFFLCLYSFIYFFRRLLISKCDTLNISKKEIRVIMKSTQNQDLFFFFILLFQSFYFVLLLEFKMLVGLCFFQRVSLYVLLLHLSHTSCVQFHVVIPSAIVSKLNSTAIEGKKKKTTTANRTRIKCRNI